MYKLEIDFFGAVKVESDRRIVAFFTVKVNDAIILNRIKLLLDDGGTYSIELPSACIKCSYVFGGVWFAREGNCLTEDAIELGTAIVNLAAETHREFLNQSNQPNCCPSC